MNSKSPNIADQAEFYNERWEIEAARPLGGLRLLRAAAILHEIAVLGLDNPKILDFGCGTGNFSAMLSHVGKVTGVELSPRAVELARNRYPVVDFRAGNVFEIGLQEASFDLLVLQEVIEHVNDQDTLIGRCCDLLRTGGFMILTTPNKTVTHKSGVYEKARLAGTLQPIENLLTVKEVRALVARRLQIQTCRTVIPAGRNGISRIVNSSKFTKYAIGRALQSALPLGLHTLVVGKKH